MLQNTAVIFTGTCGCRKIYRQNVQDPVVSAKIGCKVEIEFDTRQKKIIGLTFKVDWNYICDHPVPDPEEIKKISSQALKLLL